MKTLVIHPKDSLTDFLKEIYDGRGYTVVNDNPSNSGLKQLIKEHDRIIMLGHGTEEGLIGHGKYIINSELVYLLREKPESVYIWCYADQFVRKYDLKGFVTGMIISEYEEALLCCVSCSYSDIGKSNVLFSDAIKKSIDLKPEEMCNQVKEDYKPLGNSVMQFNHNNIFKFL